jgi:hypothetical protein
MVWSQLNLDWSRAVSLLATTNAFVATARFKLKLRQREGLRTAQIGRNQSGRIWTIAPGSTMGLWPRQPRPIFCGKALHKPYTLTQNLTQKSDFFD